MIHRATGLPHCYTLEANYARGKNINHLKPRFDVSTEQVLREEDLDVSNSFSKLYGDMYELVELRDKISNSGDSMVTTDLEEDNAALPLYQVTCT